MMWLGSRTSRIGSGYTLVTCRTLWTRRSGLMPIGLRLSSSWRDWNRATDPASLVIDSPIYRG